MSLQAPESWHGPRKEEGVSPEVPMLPLLLLATALAAPPADTTPLAAWPAAEQPPVSAGHARDLGLLAHLGPWTGEPELEEQACSLTLMVPDGREILGEPRLSVGPAGLHVAVDLSWGTGGLRVYDLELCLPSDTPVHIER